MFYVIFQYHRISIRFEIKALQVTREFAFVKVIKWEVKKLSMLISTILIQTISKYFIMVYIIITFFKYVTIKKFCLSRLEKVQSVTGTKRMVLRLKQRKLLHDKNRSLLIGHTI